MLLGERKSVQRRQASRAPSVFDAQLSSDAPQELGDSSLHWQRATQKEQIPGLHRFNISAERSWWTRQVYAKVLQPLFGTGVRCVRGHYRFSMDITRAASGDRQQTPASFVAKPALHLRLHHHRPKCAPPSTCSTSPVIWLASVR